MHRNTIWATLLRGEGLGSTGRRLESGVRQSKLCCLIRRGIFLLCYPCILLRHLPKIYYSVSDPRDSLDLGSDRSRGMKGCESFVLILRLTVAV